MTSRRDDGFTLVELMVAVVILVLVTAALAAALVVTFRTTDEANDRLARAHDVHISTSAFASDVQSADAVVGGPTSPPCGSANADLSFVWTDTAASPSPVAHVVSYQLDGQRLLRHHCKSGGMSVTVEQKLSHFVSTADAPRCDGTPCAAGAQRPREVVWQLTGTTAESHTLRGTRRTYS
jgi:prepilin-type N-terminal cleavage/methylation domain-containing protein